MLVRPESSLGLAQNPQATLPDQGGYSTQGREPGKKSCLEGGGICPQRIMVLPWKEDIRRYSMPGCGALNTVPLVFS